MHWIVPFASTVSAAGRDAAAQLELPRTAAWLRGAAEVARDEGDELGLTPPHERALGAALGWQARDGLWPFAARAAAADGIEVAAGSAWALLTPSHWHLGTEQLSLGDPAALLLGEAEARPLFDAVAPLFTSEGFDIRYAAPLRWYLAHDSLARLPTASLDRVIGRNVDPWLVQGAEGRLLRRLQNEVQMLLHGHPVNASREARGLLPVNSVWFSGTGVAQPVPPAPEAAQVDERLRSGALAEDWAAWCKAWQSLDDAWPAGLRRLTLCGERSSATFEPVRGVMNTLRRLAQPTKLHAVLQGL
jgi:hypothetical protein